MSTVLACKNLWVFIFTPTPHSKPKPPGPTLLTLCCTLEGDGFLYPAPHTALVQHQVVEKAPAGDGPLPTLSHGSHSDQGLRTYLCRTRSDWPVRKEGLSENPLTQPHMEGQGLLLAEQIPASPLPLIRFNNAPFPQLKLPPTALSYL